MLDFLTFTFARHTFSEKYHEDVSVLGIGHFLIAVTLIVLFVSVEVDDTGVAFVLLSAPIATVSYLSLFLLGLLFEYTYTSVTGDYGNHHKRDRIRRWLIKQVTGVDREEGSYTTFAYPVTSAIAIIGLCIEIPAVVIPAILLYTYVLFVLIARQIYKKETLMKLGKSPNDIAPHIKFVDAVWACTGNGSAGAVLLYDTITNEYKAYWGGVKGVDEWEDICYLVNYGHKAPIDRHGMWFNIESLPDNPFENKD